MQTALQSAAVQPEKHRQTVVGTVGTVGFSPIITTCHSDPIRKLHHDSEYKRFKVAVENKWGLKLAWNAVSCCQEIVKHCAHVGATVSCGSHIFSANFSTFPALVPNFLC
jgi:hypothetical protein